MLDKVFKFSVIAASSLYIFRALSGVCFSPGWWAMGPSSVFVVITLIVVMGIPMAIAIGGWFFLKSRK